jgi:hypothetical protein
MSKIKSVSKGTVASALGQVAAVLSTPTVAPSTPKPTTVALRGGLAIASVKLGGKPYRVTAAHNVAWWQATQKCLSDGKGVATVQALVATGMPATMVGYMVRRGYLAKAE